MSPNIRDGDKVNTIQEYYTNTLYVENEIVIGTLLL